MTCGTVAFIDDTIYWLKKADRWRWHKKNVGAIKMLRESRVRYLDRDDDPFQMQGKKQL